MANLKEIIAHNLKEKRRISGFTQAQLAEKVDVSTHHIARIETAKDYPRLELVDRIANVLDFEIYELFIDPLSIHEELNRLYQTVAKNIDRVVADAIERGIANKFKN